MSKSPKVPPPDPKLVEAQTKSLGVQDAATQEILAISRQQAALNAELLPLQKEALQFGLDSGRTAYEQSQQDRQYALERRGQLTGLQDQLVSEANKFNSEAEQGTRANAAMAGVGKTYADINAANDRELAAMGVMPGSGRQIALREANAPTLARMSVGAANDARLSARNEGRMLTDRATNALAGYPSTVAGSSGQGAAIGAGGVNTANAGVGGINSGYNALTGAQQAAGGLAGQTGANATGMWNAQANYKLNSDASANNWMGGVGALMGGVARLGTAFSDRRMKQDIERIGTHPRGIGLYRFEFRPEYRGMAGDGPQTGVMADEVREVLPAAVTRGADGFDRVDYSML